MEKVNIRKPVYGTFCYIREGILKKAIRKGEKIEVTVPDGTAIIDPQEWIDTGKRLEKVFKIPNHPMILWGNTVPIEQNK